MVNVIAQHPDGVNWQIWCLAILGLLGCKRCQEEGCGTVRGWPGRSGQPELCRQGNFPPMSQPQRIPALLPHLTQLLLTGSVVGSLPPPPTPPLYAPWGETEVDFGSWRRGALQPLCYMGLDLRGRTHGNFTQTDVVNPTWVWLPNLGTVTQAG